MIDTESTPLNLLPAATKAVAFCRRLQAVHSGKTHRCAQTSSVACPTAKLVGDEHDAIDLLTDIDAHLAFAEQAMRDWVPKEPLQKKMTTALNIIRQRREDSCLYIAIVGEFKAGKSTLINALLHYDLLITSAMPATAVPTRIRNGRQFQAVVRFRDGRVHSTPSQAPTRSDRLAALLLMPNVAQRQEREARDRVRLFLERYTAVKSGEDTAESVEVSCPSAHLPVDVVLIDTPGINEDAGRQEMTRRVLAEDADAALVIIPAERPVSMDLPPFLSSGAKPYLHRCVFVVTKMDDVKADQQEALVESIINKLSKQLELTNPEVHKAAAQIVLDELAEGGSTLPKHRMWIDAFGQLERHIWSRLRKERLVAISENLTRLLDQLYVTMNLTLAAERMNLQEKQNEIKRNTIPNLPDFASKKRSTLQTKFKAERQSVFKKLTGAIERYESEAWGKIEQTVWAECSKDSLNRNVPAKVRTILAGTAKNIGRDVNAVVKSLDCVAKQISGEFDKEFGEIYKQLQKLRGSVSVDRQLFSAEDGRDIVKAVTSFAPDRVTEDGSGMVAFLGNLVSGLLAPVDDLFGSTIGEQLKNGLKNVTEWLFGPSLDDVKRDYLAQLEPPVKERLRFLKERGEQTLQQGADALAKEIGKRIDQYVDRYSHEVARIKSEQERQGKLFAKREDSAKVTMENVVQRMKQLSAQQLRLAQVRV